MILFPDVRHSAFNLGSDVNLICSNKTLSDTIYVIWKIHLKHKYCTIAFSMHDPIKDTCDDGKSLRNTSSAQSFLHIPNFSSADVGTYTCESAYKGGSDNHEINVAITGRTVLHARITDSKNHVVNGCIYSRVLFSQSTVRKITELILLLSTSLQVHNHLLSRIKQNTSAIWTIMHEAWEAACQGKQLNSNIFLLS